MLANFFQDERLMREFSVSFSYRQSKPYDEGFKKRVSREFDVRPRRLSDVSDLHASAQKLSPPLGWLLRAWARAPMLRYWYVLCNTLRLYRVFEGIDLLHINNGNYPGAYSCMSAVFAARLRGIKRIVYVVNNIAIPYYTPRRWFDYPLDRIVASTVTVFVTASLHARAELVRVLRLPDRKARSIHNGITPRITDETREATRLRLGAPKGRLLLGVIAVLSPRKGHLILLEALSLLKRQRTNQDNLIPFIILEGVGEMGTAIDEFIARHDLGEDVRRIGLERNIFNLMAAIDAVVLPSVSHEDFPNIVLEAMSLGKPVIASNLAGVPEQIEHMKSGILVDCGDVDALAEAMQLVADDPVLRERIGKNAQQRFAERFTAEIAVSGYLALYHEVIGSKEGKPD